MGFCMTFLYLEGAGGDRAGAVGADGGRLGGAAADRQFRLGRYHLDVFARPGRRRQRAVAGAGAAPNARQWLVAALVAIWAVRLGIHIATRTREITDDPRYAAFAKEWGADAPRKMFFFLQKQALGAIPLAFAVFVAARFPGDGLRLQDFLGVAILAAGIAGEALADAQLKAFRDNPANKGKVCDVGLWRWSRHPNYFFEWFGWLAYPVIAHLVRRSAAYPWGFARCWRRCSCTGSWSTSPACRRWRSRCCARAATLSRLPGAHQRVLSRCRRDQAPSGHELGRHASSAPPSGCRCRTW